MSDIDRQTIRDLPSAQPEKRTEERTKTHACDCISRQAAISVIAKWMLEYGGEGEERERNALKQAAEEIKDLQSTQPDMSEYSDKLWKAAYERGKAEAQPDLDEVYAHAETEAEARYHAERKKGKWIYGESEAGNDGYYCSKCGNFVPWKYDEYDIDFIKEFLFCNKCGADMTGGEG